MGLWRLKPSGSYRCVSKQGKAEDEREDTGSVGGWDKHCVSDCTSPADRLGKQRVAMAAEPAYLPPYSQLWVSRGGEKSEGGSERASKRGGGVDRAQNI